MVFDQKKVNKLQALFLLDDIKMYNYKQTVMLIVTK